MKVDIKEQNSALLQLKYNENTVVFLDANTFIPPDKSVLGVKPREFSWYKEIWLEPLFDNFTNLSIHETVYYELLAGEVKNFADSMLNSNPAKLKVYYDSNLTELEKRLLLTHIDNISKHSKYNYDRDNSNDRGEVRSLAFMAVKNFLYLASNDDLPFRLVSKAEELKTGLSHMQILQAYDLIYFLLKKDDSHRNELRKLYLHLYYLTPHEKRSNPGWGEFVNAMDCLYDGVW